MIIFNLVRGLVAIFLSIVLMFVGLFILIDLAKTGIVTEEIMMLVKYMAGGVAVVWLLTRGM